LTVDLEDVPADLGPAVLATLGAVGIDHCHLAVERVDRERIRELNLEYRGRDSATDVLSFPVDPGPGSPGPRELGDVIVCEAECEDPLEAVVHGVLHLCGFDHETDDGEMLRLQDRIMDGLKGSG
jgi:probable rRNA maturation factor